MNATSTTAMPSRSFSLSKPQVRKIGTFALVVFLHALPLYFLIESGMSGKPIKTIQTEIVAMLIAPQQTPEPTPPQPQPKTTPKVAPVKKAPVAPKLPPAPNSISTPEVPETAEKAEVSEVIQTKEQVPESSAGAPADAGIPKTINSSDVSYINAPAPTYPSASRRLGEEGLVRFRVLINEKGRAEQIDVQKSSGFPRLDEAGMQAIRRALFKPYMEDGKPIPVYAIIPISFKL
jgi:protein TonB